MTAEKKDLGVRNIYKIENINGMKIGIAKVLGKNRQVKHLSYEKWYCIEKINN